MSRDYGTNKTEQSIIRQAGGQPHKNSGRGQRKGDGTYHNFTVDVKEAKSSFTLNKNTWAKICTDSVKNRGTDPMLLVVLDGQTRLAVIELSVLEELLGGNDGGHTSDST